MADWDERLGMRGTAVRRARRDLVLTEKINRVFEANYLVYGARKVWHQLRRWSCPRLERTDGIREEAWGYPQEYAYVRRVSAY